MHNAPAAIAALCLFAATNCGTLPPVSAATSATVSKAQADVQAAINLYGVAKGMAQVASLAAPGLAPIVAGVTLAVDPLVANAQTALNGAASDAAALESLATQISAQANALTLKTAPAIKVVPSTAPAPAA